MPRAGEVCDSCSAFALSCLAEICEGAVKHQTHLRTRLGEQHVCLHVRESSSSSVLWELSPGIVEVPVFITW